MSKPKNKTILQAKRPVAPVVTRAPIIKEKLKSDKNLRVLEAVLRLYPKIDTTYITGLLEIQWLNPTDTDFISNIQEILDAIEQAGVPESDYIDLSLLIDKVSLPEKVLSRLERVVDMSTSHVVIKSNMKAIKSAINAVSNLPEDSYPVEKLLEVLNRMNQAYVDQQVIYTTIRNADNLGDIQLSLAQFQSAEVLHGFHVKSLLIRPKGMLGTVACTKCGCYEYYRESIQTAGWDEPTRIVDICAGC